LEATLDEQLYMQHVYQKLDINAFAFPLRKKKEQLKEMMIGKVSMFSGHSGVGKSTLVNAMEPSLHLKQK
jgi:ribosome biogenesis GTPase